MEHQLWEQSGANRREIPIGKANLNIHESEFFETTMEKGNVANLVRYQTKKTNLFFSSARCIVVVL